MADKSKQQNDQEEVLEAELVTDEEVKKRINHY